VSDVVTRDWGTPSDGPPLSDGLRIYAVGDLHGRFDLLQAMATLIRRDLATAPSPRSIEIFLGDYVDRGPRSREVVDWLIDTPPIANERICLMGNHEDMLLEALNEPGAAANWLYNGGDATLASYGINVRPYAARTNISGLLREHLPPKHRAFLEGLKRMADYNPYLFVHAGIRPGRRLAEQDPKDLVWIREPFLFSEADLGRVVVHGHTPVERPEVRPNRVNIDTGAFFSGCLTCLVLAGSTRRFLQTEM
jgi:serine/threonine protein phosphatase 1